MWEMLVLHGTTFSSVAVQIASNELMVSNEVYHLPNLSLPRTIPLNAYQASYSIITALNHLFPACSQSFVKKNKKYDNGKTHGRHFGPVGFLRFVCVKKTVKTMRNPNGAVSNTAHSLVNSQCYISVM